ncbi:unnamed protein product [Didymodactylos carnosus]|uniref:Uncharacterized protein n=1 Tax=Didymodactylos carnosus TaxID=1234261 RepID=A0A815U789_9BILA|nr:unnamed protein product [Didymodactylos carnosus]CAF1515838.1 unnamed protein product [Didymodactylos carnosus]CAF4255571.1 unnamed protein product [Didymodactylos carnosus]CAF4375729.1 unnamed protein product [Didymodactylos carnosus]
MDQTIECTINKMGKGHGGLSGRFSPQLIDIWSKSFAFRSLLTSIASELAGYETSSNSIDSYVECSPTRAQSDEEDLSLILSKLKYEKLYTSENDHVTQLFTGKLIHNDIINGILGSKTRGLEALQNYISVRLVNKTVLISEPLKAMPLLRLSDNDDYDPGMLFVYI